MRGLRAGALGVLAWTGVGNSVALAQDAFPHVRAVPVATRGEASFHVDVPAHAWRALALENLPAGTTVRATVRATAPMQVRLLPAEQLATYPTSRPALFDGRVEDRLEFSVAVPSTGHYAVVLDNRSGDVPSTADLRVEAATRGASPTRKESATPDPAI